MRLNGKITIALIIACALPLLAGAAHAQEITGADAPPPVEAAPATVESVAEGPAAATPSTSSRDGWRFKTEPDTFALVDDSSGLSPHKAMYLLPATYSDRYPGRSTEVLFAISLKLKPYKPWPIFLAYSQKSFFQAFNGKDSKPFRENDFNPEAFYRFKPKDPQKWFHLGGDIGIEHESNGESLPGSRSWNRIYIAPHWEVENTLIYWKWWYRIPEDKDRPVTDPKRDDNPDIQDYYGYSELHIEQQFFKSNHLLHAMVRYNPARGRGALNLQYSIPVSDNFYWGFYVWQGYGESLGDYNRSVTRVGLGILLTR